MPAQLIVNKENTFALAITGQENPTDVATSSLVNNVKYQ